MDNVKYKLYPHKNGVDIHIFADVVTLDVFSRTKQVFDISRIKMIVHIDMIRTKNDND